MIKGETLGFEEEAYAIFYEVIESTNKLATRGVPIYCAYTTDLANVKPPRLQNQVAIFPNLFFFFLLRRSAQGKSSKFVND